jgi:hypothetical protein
VRAAQERAVGTYRQQALQQNAEVLVARQRAAMASSGGDASGGDGTSAAIITKTSSRASMEQLLTQAQAEDTARQDNYEAVLTRKRGKNAQAAANFQAAGSFLSAASSAAGGSNWGSMFGGGKGGMVEPVSGMRV